MSYNQLLEFWRNQMKKFKPIIDFYLFWLPFAVSIILNPGKNFINLNSFTSLKLYILLACGILELVYFLLLLTQPNNLNTLFIKANNKVDLIKYLIFSSIWGLGTILYAMRALLGETI